MDKEWKEVEGEDKEGLVGKSPNMLTSWKESFLKAFKVIDKELKFHPTIDYFCNKTCKIHTTKLLKVSNYDSIYSSHPLLCSYKYCSLRSHPI